MSLSHPSPRESRKRKRQSSFGEFHPGWRRGRDSNPRGACTPNGFRDRHLQPLGHLSAAVFTRLSGPDQPSARCLRCFPVFGHDVLATPPAGSAALSGSTLRRARPASGACGHAGPPELEGKHLEAVFVPLAPAPIADFRKRDAIPDGDRDRHPQALTVVPMVEGRQAVSAGVGGRERQGPRTTAAAPDGPDVEVLSDAERPAGELNVECSVWVNVAIPVPIESERRHRLVERFRRGRLRQDEVHID